MKVCAMLWLHVSSSINYEEAALLLHPISTKLKFTWSLLFTFGVLSAHASAKEFSGEKRCQGSFSVGFNCCHMQSFSSRLFVFGLCMPWWFLFTRKNVVVSKCSLIHSKVLQLHSILSVFNFCSAVQEYSYTKNLTLKFCITLLIPSQTTNSYLIWEGF